MICHAVLTEPSHVLVKLRGLRCQYSVSAVLFAFTFSHMGDYVKTSAFFKVTPCGTVYIYGCYSAYLSLFLLFFSTLKIEALGFSETPFNFYAITCSHIVLLKQRAKSKAIPVTDRGGV
jgi:hypothetical protein